MKTAKDIDSYIKACPKETQELLKQIRSLIKKLLPKSEEAIKYGIPTFRMFNKNVVHFGGFKTHISFFPGADGVAEFEKELTKFKVSKGTIQFPLGKKLPSTLIAKIVKFRLAKVSETTKK